VRRIALVLLVLLVLLVIFISVILVEHYTNSKNHYLEISSTEVQNFVNTKYNSDRFNVISNHTTPDNLYFYVLLFDKTRKNMFSL